VYNPRIKSDQGINMISKEASASAEVYYEKNKVDVD